MAMKKSELIKQIREANKKLVTQENIAIELGLHPGSFRNISEDMKPRQISALIMRCKAAGIKIAS
jgi:hypothetical protein